MKLSIKIKEMEENPNENTDNQDINDSLSMNEGEELTQNGTSENPKQSECEELLSAEKDKYVRLYAEFDNFKKRTQKEKIEFYTYASQDTLTALLPVLDDFERALKQMQNSPDIQESSLEGVQLIYNKLYQTLKEKGLQKIELKPGDEFDVDTQEAITQMPVEDPSMQNKIVDIIENGYRLGEKVIRHAKVVIGK